MRMTVGVRGVAMLSVLNPARPVYVVPFKNLPTPKKIPPVPSALLGRRSTALSLALLPSLFMPTCLPSPSKANADYQYQQDEEEERVVRLFQETTRSVVSIKDIEVPNPKTASQSSTSEVAEAIVEGTGSGFVWDKLGHIVTNYHVVAKLASDTTGRQQCEVSLLDTDGNAIVKKGQLIGIDAAHDLAVLKVDVPENYLKPVMLGSSQSVRVGQNCFAIGNPYGYDHTLTTGVVSGLGREIPSPIGRPIQGAIQTDAAINGGFQIEKKLNPLVYCISPHWSLEASKECCK